MDKLELQDKLVDITAGCVLYGGWPCLTCFTHAVKEKRITQKMVEEWWPDVDFNDHSDYDPIPEGTWNPWDKVIDHYLENVVSDDQFGTEE